MAERAELVATCDRYVELVDAGDTDGIMALYADECWIEDPIGSERKVGREAIREFYAGIAAMEVDPKMTRIGPVTVCGGEAAFQFRIDIEIGELTIKMTSTDVMTFDANGRITSMRAFADGEADPDA
ncbi:MAG: ksi 2 [Acidimicrobiales bacterium]|nr:ksi 2 [Acidimicrobiales bacterium]